MHKGAKNYLEMPIIHFYVENLAVFHQTCNSSSENVKTRVKIQITNIPHRMCFEATIDKRFQQPQKILSFPLNF